MDDNRFKNTLVLSKYLNCSYVNNKDLKPDDYYKFQEKLQTGLVNHLGKVILKFQKHNQDNFHYLCQIYMCYTKYKYLKLYIKKPNYLIIECTYMHDTNNIVKIERQMIELLNRIGNDIIKFQCEYLSWEKLSSEEYKDQEMIQQFIKNIII